MNISGTVLQKAVDEKIIDSQQAEALFNFIQNQSKTESGFNLNNVLYYFGGFFAIGAMSLLMNVGWKTFGGWGIFFLCLLYAFIGLYLSSKFQKKSLIIPAQICATFVICLAPLAIYAFQLGMDWWPENKHPHDYNYLLKLHCIFMELGTLLIGIVLAWKYRYAFMIIPIAVTGWFMSMDFTTMMLGVGPDFVPRANVSLCFGLVVMLCAFCVDVRPKKSVDYAFWLYIFGVLAFWGGMTAQDTNNELLKFVYLCINIIMMGLGVLLMRKVFNILGGIGSTLYLAHLTAQVFQGSVLFPLALTIIGFMIIYIGTLWQKNAAQITQTARSILPKPIQDLLVRL